MFVEIIALLAMAGAAAVLGFGKDGKGVIITDSDVITLSTLGNNTVIKQTAPLAFTDRFRLIKCTARVTLKGITANEGPLLFGLASNALSVTQIAAAISANGPTSRQQKTDQNEAELPVWVLGSFASLSATIVELLKATSSGTDGYVSETIRWTFGVDASPGYSFWVQNRSGGALQTGGVVTVETKMFGVWTD